MASTYIIRESRSLSVVLHSKVHKLAAYDGCKLIVQLASTYIIRKSRSLAVVLHSKVHKLAAYDGCKLIF